MIIMNNLNRFAKAKSPIDSELLRGIPHFSSIFQDESLWPLLVRLSGDDGIAHIEQKQFKEGEKLVAKGQFDQMIYWVLSGNANVITMIKGQLKVIHQAGQGECIGELGVLRGAVRSADVVGGVGGVRVLELDWAITEKSPELAKDLYHLIALNLADKLDRAYDAQLRILANSLRLLQEKTSRLIENKRKLEKLLKSHHINFAEEPCLDHEQAVSHAIAGLRESLSLLEIQEQKYSLDRLGVV